MKSKIKNGQRNYRIFLFECMLKSERKKNQNFHLFDNILKNSFQNINLQENNTIYKKQSIENFLKYFLYFQLILRTLQKSFEKF